ncbi:hypothetical protein PRIPAC_90395 [Pristionchus pacificus]|uniref:Uncharacterized protein n=1 Tax=Pristionchus pacificus TaxID=54126 RepID=A0A2A6CVB2_PRIPA|nr:hypothetical protein PRIPAC_90395 [Pristionchus pacificus]|eukprot:PDM82162.1 hypothetical protein PRIPAC_36555 [Pristionchus pacificus]
MAKRREETSRALCMCDNTLRINAYRRELASLSVYRITTHLQNRYRFISYRKVALIKMGYQKAVLLSRFHFEGSRASGLVFFPYHSRNGWRKSPAPYGVARRLSPTVGRIRSLACAGVFFVLESSKLENPSLSERCEPGF